LRHNGWSIEIAGMKKFSCWVAHPYGTFYPAKFGGLAAVSPQLELSAKNFTLFGDPFPGELGAQH